MLNIIFTYSGTVSLIVFLIGLLFLYEAKNETKVSIAKGLFCASVIISLINLVGPKILTADVYTSTAQVKITDQQQGTKFLFFNRSYFIPFTFQNELTVEYDGQEYRLRGDDVYEKYKADCSAHLA